MIIVASSLDDIASAVMDPLRELEIQEGVTSTWRAYHGVETFIDNNGYFRQREGCYSEWCEGLKIKDLFKRAKKEQALPLLFKSTEPLMVSVGGKEVHSFGHDRWYGVEVYAYGFIDELLSGADTSIYQQYIPKPLQDISRLARAHEPKRAQEFEILFRYCHESCPRVREMAELIGTSLGPFQKDKGLIRE